MSRETLGLPPELAQFILEHTVDETPVMQALRKRTAQLPEAIMQISPEQGQFMGWLVRLIGARRTLEVGTFTGYSTLAVAQALPSDGQIIACDISSEFTSIAQPFWQEAKVADKIDLRIGPAVETLDQLIAEGAAGTFDFAFIDADKTNYDRYYEQSLTLLKPGGLIAVDNAFWGGSIANKDDDRPDTVAIRNLVLKIAQDKRVDATLNGIGDGLYLVSKR